MKPWNGTHMQLRMSTLKSFVTLLRRRSIQ